MANFKLTQTGEQIQADLDLLDKNSATSGQVLTANGTGGASWQNASGGGGGGLYYHQITLSFTPNNPDEKKVICTIAASHPVNSEKIDDNMISLEMSFMDSKGKASRTEKRD